MRPASSVLAAALGAVCLGGLGLLPSAQASLLPQIEEARALQETRGPGPSTLTKHFVEISPGIYVAVHGGRERRQVRFARWVDSLAGDRLVVYLEEGFPTHRLRENDGGVRTELWSYPDAGRVYRFRGDTLLEVRGPRS